MIKFRGERDGKPLYGFGLSEGNLRKLREGHPILVDLAAMKGEGSVFIFWGQTEADMVRDLRTAGLLDPGVGIHLQEPVQPGEFQGGSRP